ncbi:MAG: rRNA maturation RNase YbeY [Candidatus Magasanikbacteria bacterium]
MDCNVFFSVKNKILKETEIQKIVSDVLSQQKRKGNISVHIVGDKKIRDINKIYRDKDKVTDVISFAIEEGENIFDFIDEKDLGDIFICANQIRRQAKENNISEKEEMIRMLVHGILHILGYDHLQEVDAKKMFALQEKFVKKCYVKIN